MSERHGTWRLFDVPPTYIVIGVPSGEVRKVRVPGFTTAEFIAFTRLGRCLSIGGAKARPQIIGRGDAIAG